MNNCDLNGSGGYGAELIGANDVKFYNVNIFNNVFYAIYAINSFSIKFEECNIYDNHDWGLSVIYSEISDLSFKNCNINDNQSNNLIYTSLDGLPYTNFENCNIENNPFIFNLQEYIEDSSQINYALSKKGKRTAMLKLFMIFLMEERFDYDIRNVVFLSFFSNKYKIKYKGQRTQSDYLSVNFLSLKEKGFKIKNYEIIENRIIINKDTKNQEIWTFSLNKRDKFKKIKIE